MLARIWFFPLELLGVLVARLTGSTEVLHAEGGAVFVDARGIVDRLLRSLGFSAMTVGSTVFLAAGYSPVRPYLVRHELAHVEQGRRWGALFPAAYFVGWSWAFLGTFDWRLAYWRNPFEVEARAAERAVQGHDEDA